MSLTKKVKIVLMLLGIALIIFVVYGLITDCPNTAGYFFCSESEREFIRQ